MIKKEKKEKQVKDILNKLKNNIYSKNFTKFDYTSGHGDLDYDQARTRNSLRLEIIK